MHIPPKATISEISNTFRMASMTAITATQAAAGVPSGISADSAPAATQATMADHCDEEFKKVYETTYRSLNSAKAFHEGPRRSKMLCFESILPKNVKTCRFLMRLDATTSTNIKYLHDVASTKGQGLVDLLYHLAFEYRTCTWVDTVRKYNIANIQNRNGFTHPVDAQAWDKLLVFTQSLVHSKQLDGRKICSHKRAKTMIHQGSSSFYQQALERAMMGNDMRTLANLAACLVWFLETPNMNKSYEVYNSAAGSSQYNTSTLLCRTYTPPAEPEPTVAPKEEEEEEAPVEEDETDDFGEVVENWEDLDF